MPDMYIPDMGRVFANLGSVAAPPPQAVPLETPMDWQKDAVAMEKLQQEQRDMRQKAADDEAMRRITAETGGDPELMLPRLRKLAPGLALKFEQEMGDARKKMGDAHKVELENDLAEGEHGMALLRSVTDEASYQRMKPLIAKYAPELAQSLPEHFDPLVIKEMMAYGETTSEYLKRNLDAYKFMAEGKPLQGAAIALSTATTPEEWAETQAGLKAMGIPNAVLQIIGPFGPDAQARAEKLAMSPDERADNVREDRKQENVERGDLVDEAERMRANKARESDTRRGQDIGAQTTRRGQDIGAETARRGQNIGAETARSTKAGAQTGPDLPTMLGEVDTLVGRINKGAGVGATAQGYIRRGMSKVNMDNDVAEYEVLVRGMIPIVARAVGHTGVLTQEDADSVKAMFPVPGDSETLAANKLARIKKLLKVTPAAATGGAPADDAWKRYQERHKK